MTSVGKTSWRGELAAIQPRIRLLRSFDQRQHSYLGYTLRVSSGLADGNRDFLVAIGKAAQAKHAFRIGDRVQGQAVPVVDQPREMADFYKTSGLKLLARSDEPLPEPPPYLGVPPTLEVYRQRGHRRLDARTYSSSCSRCIWGCRMPVEMIIDPWKPSDRRHRIETFCYGPKSCKAYRAGPTRVVPGRKGMSWTEEDWIDDEATRHRADDE